jgi:hypothetical protein
MSHAGRERGRRLGVVAVPRNSLVSWSLVPNTTGDQPARESGQVRHRADAVRCDPCATSLEAADRRDMVQKQLSVRHVFYINIASPHELSRTNMTADNGHPYSTEAGDI